MLKRNLNRIEEGFLSLLLVLMTLLVFMEVVLRFGFNTGLLWAQELTLHISAWFVLFGASYGVKVGAHIGVDAVVKLLPPKLQRATSMLAVVLALLYCGLFLFGSWVYLYKMYKIGIGMEDVVFPFGIADYLPEGLLDILRIDPEEPYVPLWMAHGILIIGMLMLAYRLFQLLWNIAMGRSEGFHLADEAKDSMHLAEELKADKKGEGESKE